MVLSFILYLITGQPGNGYVTNKTLPFINTRIHDKIQKIYQKRLIPSLKKRGTYVKTPPN